MKEQLVSFEVAKLAKEKGFGLGENDYIQLHTVYEPDGSLYNDGELKAYVHRKYNSGRSYLGANTIDDFEGSVFTMDNSLDEFILAPTQSLLQKWLREVHKLYIIAGTYRDGWDELKFQWKTEEFDPEKGQIGYETYEEALEKGLLEGLKLIK